MRGTPRDEGAGASRASGASPDATVTVAALVPAAGRGVRLGPGAPKALRLLAGEPLLVHAVRGLRAAPSVGPVVVAAPPEDVEAAAAMLASYGVQVVAGGAERQASVERALSALGPDVDLVLVHDAARCLTPVAVVEAVVAALRAGAEAVVPVLPVADTVKEVAGSTVVRTVDRSALRAVQTPQGFRRDVLEQAHRSAPGLAATDDAGLVERLGRSVVTVPGSQEAFKVTRPLDLALAEAVLAGRASGG
jgi:2-C-methyl-D-erythritol 4-phosphate cytidylyltransferase